MRLPAGFKLRVRHGTRTNQWGCSVSLKAPSLGLAAAIVTAIGFGICGILFGVAPGPTAAVVSWVLHIDITGMSRSISVPQLLIGLVLVGAYVGLIVGLTAALYNRLTRGATA